MARYDVDLYVIGGGSAGVRMARVSSGMGARVALAEERFLGGTCVNVGCVPKKLFSYGAHYGREFEDARGYGWSVEGVRFDWATLRDNKDREIQRLNDVYRSLLDGSGVETHDARACIVDPHTVEVDGRTVTAENIVVAVGGRPFVPDIPNADLGVVSDDMFTLDELPRRALVVGGGYIGVEFAGILNGLGVETTLTYRRELFLRGFDDDVRGLLAEEMRGKGIRVLFESDVIDLERTDDGIEVELATPARLAPPVVDLVLFATGRIANTAGLGLEAAGVEMDVLGNVPVDELSRTNVPSIWALGDVTDRVALTPVAIHEAMCLARTLYGGEPTSPDHDLVASAVFSDPELATVGLTEAEARERHDDVVIYRSNFRPLRYTMTDNPERTLMKLVVDGATDRVLGVHVLGRDAAELVQGVAIAVKMGATKADFDRTMGIHPTAGEELVTMREPVGD